MKEWCGIHQFTLSVLVHSSLRSAGGVEESLRLGRVIFIVLSSRRGGSSPSDEDPACAFTIRAIQVAEREHGRGFNTSIPAGQLTPDEELGKVGFCGHSSATTRVGFLLVACVAVEGMSFALTAQYPVFRAFHHPDDTPLDQQMTAVFKDLNRVFQTFINNGVVLQSAPGQRPTTPHSGYMVRKRKGWTWQQDQRAWQYMDAVMPYNIIPFGTTFSATDLWIRFTQW